LITFAAGYIFISGKKPIDGVFHLLQVTGVKGGGEESGITPLTTSLSPTGLKVPKCEIFDPFFLHQ
jgi:hypothetical protein